MSKTKLAVAVFIASESVFFALLVVGYVHFSGSGHVDTAGLLDPVRTFMFSLALFGSSATVRRTSRHLQRGSVGKLGVWLLLTIALGVIFLAGQAIEWVGLIRSGVSVAGGLFGTTFFTLTGFHGLHVIVGLIALGTLFFLGLSGRLRPAHLEGLEGVELYWHFVDAVWVVIFSVVYIGAVV